MSLRIMGLSEVLRLCSTDGEAQHSLGYPIASDRDADFRAALRIARLERARKRLVPVFGALAMAVAVLSSLEARYGANTPPTVIFIVMDTLRADRTSLRGYVHPTTPKLEALVERGARYACNSPSTSTWTLPSHATFFPVSAQRIIRPGPGATRRA